VGGGGVLLGAAAYLIKTALTQRLAQEAETFKTRLKADADAEIERLKHSHQITALEHQVRFSKLRERRAEIIAELYRRLVEVDEEGRLFVRDTGGSPNRIEQFQRYDEVTKKNVESSLLLESTAFTFRFEFATCETSTFTPYVSQ